MSGGGSSRRRRRLWRFAGAEFDEAGWMLRVGGRAVALEGKPLEVLHELLLRAGEVVTKDELLDTVWSGVVVVEGSLSTAMSKLRKALGGGGDDVIETVARIGYRLIAPVSVESIDAPLAPRFAFDSGDPVPGRRQWLLERPLGETGSNDVWLARHAKTGQLRVFKFADAPDRLRALKREAALTRVIHAALGDDAPSPPLLEWSYDAPPFFLEYAFAGLDLAAWSKQAGGLAALPLGLRLDIAARIARALAAVHDLGVLHKDLKPANIVVSDGPDGPLVRLADFGCGGLVDDGVLDRFQITDPGELDAGLASDASRSGTPAYRAPELAGDATPTVRSDIYALGLILYQLVVADFGATLSPGWEERVDDPLLRDDIRSSASGNPAARLPSALILAERIEGLEERRRDADAEARRQVREESQRATEARRAARRPWIRAAAASLAAGMLGSAAFAYYALEQRDEAIAARELADTSFGFVAEDVLSSPDPVRSSAEETVLEAMKRASANIDARFARSPGTAARLHLAVARAFHARSDFETARSAYGRADALFAKAGETRSDDAVTGRLNSIQLEATSGQPGALETAGRMLAKERAALGPRGDSGRTGFALAVADGNQAYMGDVARAETAFRKAVEIASRPESDVPATQALKARSSLVLTLIRLGRAAQAEPIARAIVAESALVRGADHPDTLVTQQHWLTTLSYVGRHEQVVSGSVPLLARMQARFGPDHRLTLALRSTRFESLSALGRYGEAAAEAKRVWEGASAQAGPRSHQALVGQTDYGAALCQTPQRSNGLAVTQAALDGVATAFAPDYPLRHVVGYYVAECLLANGKFAEADQALADVDRAAAAQLLGRPDFGSEVDLLLAESAGARGDTRKARQLLASAAKLNGSADRSTIARIARIKDAIRAVR